MFKITKEEIQYSVLDCIIYKNKIKKGKSIAFLCNIAII